MKSVCIFGMGYVGLTMAVVLAEKGFKVTGVDVDEKVVKAINDYKPLINEEGLITLLKKHLNKGLIVTTKIPKPQDVVILAVGTPVNMETKLINYDYIVNASMQVKKVMKDDTLVILRSTVSIGATRDIVKPILDQVSNPPFKNYYLAFCPERTIQGRAIRELTVLPQIIGGVDIESTEAASNFFGKITSSIIEVSSCEVAELIKKINNTYRDLTFSFANEVAELCETIGLDAYEVINSANQDYQRSNIPLPGFVGGYCLSKDPYILLGLANKYGVKMDLVKQARLINEQLPKQVARRIQEYMLRLKQLPSKTKIFITGFAFKGIPDTDDIRNSPTVELVKELKKLGYNHIYGHDFVVGKNKLSTLPITLCDFKWGFKNCDVIIIANNHRKYRLIRLNKYITSKNKLVFDAWATFKDEPIWENADIKYMAIGLK